MNASLAKSPSARASIETTPAAVGAADWSREKLLRFWDPGRQLLLSIRRYQRLRDRRGIFARALRSIVGFQHKFWSVASGADIPLNCKIGGGLLIPHPNGIVIHPEATIGANCLVFQQVTIGTRGIEGLPVINPSVEIGAGAKILGPIHVGTGAKIGANAVVLRDVANGAVAVGIYK